MNHKYQIQKTTHSISLMLIEKIVIKVVALVSVKIDDPSDLNCIYPVEVFASSTTLISSFIFFLFFSFDHCLVPLVIFLWF